jgi:hypothetical protein
MTQGGSETTSSRFLTHCTSLILFSSAIRLRGEELSAVSTYHPGRAAALVYLDAAGTFAFYNPKHGDYIPALAQLRDDLSVLHDDLFDDGLISKTLTDMALFQANLVELRGEVEGATGPSPQASDLASISAYQSYMKGYYGGIIPESEVRQMHRIGEDGTVGEFLGLGYVAQSIMLGEERFHSIETPLLAIFSILQLPIQVRRATRQNSQPIEPQERVALERRWLSFGGNPTPR